MELPAISATVIRQFNNADEGVLGAPIEAEQLYVDRRALLFEASGQGRRRGLREEVLGGRRGV